MVKNSRLLMILWIHLIIKTLKLKMEARTHKNIINTINQNNDS